MAQRLRGHLNKLKGSQKINLSAVGYKALVLDKSMSTAANEDVLTAVFGAKHSGMWNNKGFGPKVQVRSETQLSQAPSTSSIQFALIILSKIFKIWKRSRVSSSR